MKNVTAATVRAWAIANLDLLPTTDDEGNRNYPCLGEGARGRLPEAITEAFRKAHKGRKGYEPTVAEGATVTFKATVLDSAGRKTTREVTIPVTEARGLYKSASKGRLNMTLVREGYEAQFAATVAGQFNKAA